MSIEGLVPVFVNAVLKPEAYVSALLPSTVSSAYPCSARYVRALASFFSARAVRRCCEEASRRGGTGERNPAGRTEPRRAARRSSIAIVHRVSTEHGL